MVKITAEESYALKMCFLIDKSKGPRNLILMSWVKKRLQELRQDLDLAPPHERLFNQT